MIKNAKKKALDVAKSISTSEEKVYNCTDTQYIEAVNGLCYLAERIIKDYTDKLDIFDYIPLTKQGKFPKNQTILLADTKIANVVNGGYYVAKYKLQLRLVEAYSSTEDFINKTCIENTLALEIDLYQKESKTLPVFNSDGIPSKTERARNTYLKDDEIKAGSSYIDAKGTEYLYLGKLRLTGGILKDNESADNLDTRKLCPGHVYTKMTKQLKKLLEQSQSNSLTELVDKIAIAYTNADNMWCETSKISWRENPRKFTQLVTTYVQDEPIATHTITTEPYKNYDDKTFKWGLYISREA